MPRTAKSGKRGAEGNDETKNKTENLSKDALRKAETWRKKMQITQNDQTDLGDLTDKTDQTETDQTDQTDQSDQTDQTDQTD